MNAAEILFEKIEDEMIEKQVNQLGNEGTTQKTEEENLISFDDFMKVQLKVAEVLEAEKVEKSEKLLKLQVKIGDEQKQIIAGISKSYSPEELKGKKIVVVANLKPAKLMGLESQGMVLAVEDESGKLKVLSVENSVKIGSRVK